MPVLTKNLGAYGYGLWSQVSVTIGLSLIVVQLGISDAIVRFFPGKNFKNLREDLYAIIAIVILITGLFSILLFSFPRILANAIFDGNVIIVRLVAVIIFVNCLDRIFMSIFQAFREMKKRATISIISTYSHLGLAISLVLLGYGVIGAIFSILIVNTAQLIVLSIIISKKIPLKKPNFSSVKEYIHFGLPIIPKHLFSLIINMSDRYVIGLFLGATFVGYYTPGYGLGMMLPKFITSIFGIVLLPNLSKFLDEDNMIAVKNTFKSSLKYFLLISIPSVVGLTIVGRPILSWFTTPEIAQEGYIILVLSSIAGIPIGLYVIFNKTLLLKKRTKLISVYMGIGATINLLGNIIFVPRIGIVAAGITTIISYLIVAILMINFSFKEIPIDVDFISIGKIVFSSILMGVILSILNLYVWSNFVFLILIGICVYFSTLYLVRGINKMEIQFLKRLYR